MRALKDQVYLVTGGGGAIARHIIKAFVGAGARAVAVDRSEQHARPAEEVGGIPLAADLSTAEGAAAMVSEATERLGRIDGLVHTVGGFAMGKLWDADDALYDQMFDRNVRTLFHAVRAVLPPLRARGEGFICGFASEPAWTGAAPGSALYGAAKSAVATLLRSLDGELTGTGIEVSIVYPMGAVDTPANRRDMPSTDPLTLIDPVEVAETIVFAAQRGRRGRLLELPIYPPR